MKEIIQRIALLNALSHEGNARAGSVLGKLLAECPHLKTRAKEVTSIIAEVVQEINKFSSDKQRKIVEEKWPKALVKKKADVEKVLPPLLNVDKYERVVTRFAPNPDCLLHLGSARAIILCYEYAEMYHGLFLLRFEDTDPRLKKSALQFYDLIREDVAWLKCKWNAEFTQSDRLSIYYRHAEKILKEGNAYVCACKPKEFREKIVTKQPCSCRNLTPKENFARWERMLDGTYGEGKVVVRIKTDLNHPNPAVRDWPALRIIDTKKHSHPRVGSKYRVWPLYNFASGIDDHLMGITHIIRGKEHLTNQTRQEYLYQYFGWKYPEAIHYGRLRITGASLSKSEIVRGLRSGLFRSWDDPRLATFAALRRRGIKAGAIRRLMIDVGPKAAEVTLSWENLYAYNRKIVDPMANRYFFVGDPRELVVKGLHRNFNAKLRVHPDQAERGFRLFEIRPKDGKLSFWISSEDIKLMEKDRIIRLMGLFNFQVKEVTENRAVAVFHSEPYERAKTAGAALIHWVPCGAGIPCEVVMPDVSVVEGIAEGSCREVCQGNIIQFERFGFVRVDNIDEKLTTYFAHR
ncbi:MAG: glutamate--tRNA ligase [Candidatus Bathyarchaeota archaeon]|nr:MAG: glutamate--tRNA ligase [Candidatus Bathyarchaeota archaeon]